MSLISKISGTAGRLAGDVSQSVRRAKLEGERRVLERQHRAALHRLGERVIERVRAGELSDAGMAPEVADVEAKRMEIDAKITELQPPAGDVPLAE
jgi:hypothetical protein